MNVVLVYLIIIWLLLDSIINVDEKYYQQIFLEKCEYVVKKEKIINSINEELNLDKSDSESDNEFKKED